MVFFFSSRIRHTRCSRDWSSDVCSSDLNIDGWSSAPQRSPLHDESPESQLRCRIARPGPVHRPECSDEDGRSEERRVGKESITLGLPTQIVDKSSQTILSSYCTTQRRIH